MAIRSYKPLIKLAEQVLDEKRRRLGELQQQEAAILAAIAAIEQEVVNEQAIAAASPEISFVYPAYAAVAFRKRDALLEQVDQVRRKIELARIEVQGAHQEVRKFEKAEENRLKKLAVEAERREDLAMDELALVMHRHNKGGGA